MALGFLESSLVPLILYFLLSQSTEQVVRACNRGTMSVLGHCELVENLNIDFLIDGKMHL